MHGGCRMSAKNLLVLDIDETLLYAADAPLSRPEDFRVGQYWVYCRPFLQQFLGSAFDWFNVGFGHSPVRSMPRA